MIRSVRKIPMRQSMVNRDSVQIISVLAFSLYVFLFYFFPEFGLVWTTACFIRHKLASYVTFFCSFCVCMLTLEPPNVFCSLLLYKMTQFLHKWDPSWYEGFQFLMLSCIHKQLFKKELYYSNATPIKKVLISCSYLYHLC